MAAAFCKGLSILHLPRVLSTQRMITLVTIASLAMEMTTTRSGIVTYHFHTAYTPFQREVSDKNLAVATKNKNKPSDDSASELESADSGSESDDGSDSESVEEDITEKGLDAEVRVY